MIHQGFLRFNFNGAIMRHNKKPNPATDCDCPKCGATRVHSIPGSQHRNCAPMTGVIRAYNLDENGDLPKNENGGLTDKHFRLPARPMRGVWQPSQ